MHLCDHNRTPLLETSKTAQLLSTAASSHQGYVASKKEDFVPRSVLALRSKKLCSRNSCDGELRLAMPSTETESATN